jgi:hypothetical protein
VLGAFFCYYSIQLDCKAYGTVYFYRSEAGEESNARR